MRRMTVGKKQLNKKSQPSSPPPPPPKQAGFFSQTSLINPFPFRSTDDDIVNDNDADTADDYDPASSPFARMVRKTAEEAEKLVCRGEVHLR
jgi:hypothetical protein